MVLTIVGLMGASASYALGPNAVRAGFDANVLPGNDDSFTGLVSIGSTLNFFGNDYSDLYVNNNGNVTFDFPLPTYTPFNLTSTGRIIIAPFFADVDTRVGNVVTYGTETVDGHPAFGVNWPGVGCFNRNSSVLNYFQLMLIDRSDITPGDFDIEFNYDQIEWETGQASGGNSNCLGGFAVRIGFSNGTGDPGTFFELPGSAISGAFLDSNLITGLIHSSLNSTQLGRYVFRVRNGSPVVCGNGILETENGEQCDDGNTADGDGCSAICELENEAPDCSAAAPSVSVIWPPNHQGVPVSIVGVTDPDGDEVSITIDSIRQDEPVLEAGTGSGQTCPDGAGIDTGNAEVRAERAGNPKAPGDGRVYHIAFTADDGLGGTCTGEVTVCVPHGQRPGNTCVDQGPLFDSTVCP
jgi:cysteine-rich repeat protein